MADIPKEDVEKKPDASDREGAKRQNDSGVQEDMTKRQQQAERPNTADKHLPNVEIEDEKAKKRAEMKDQMRDKSGRDGAEASRDQQKGQER